MNSEPVASVHVMSDFHALSSKLTMSCKLLSNHHLLSVYFQVIIISKIQRLNIDSSADNRKEPKNHTDYLT